MSTSTLSTVTERVTDVLATGAGALQDVAASVASSAAEQIEALPDRVAELTGKRKRPSRRPWVFAAVALITFLGVAWWLRSRRSAGPAVDRGVDDGNNPVRSHTDRAVTATGH